MEKPPSRGKFSLLSGLLYFGEKHTTVVLIEAEHYKQQILKVCHYYFLSGHLSEDRTLDRMRSTAWWVKSKYTREAYGLRSESSLGTVIYEDN